MKNLVIALIVMFGFTFTVNAQVHYKQDGTPDMRYKENKSAYGNSYSTPSSSYSQPSSSYSQPNNIYSTPSSSYNQPTYTQPTYTQPMYTQPTYTNPSTGSISSYPSYPTKKDGTPDMRYKENKSLYGR